MLRELNLSEMEIVSGGTSSLPYELTPEGQAIQHSQDVYAFYSQAAESGISFGAVAAPDCETALNDAAVTTGGTAGVLGAAAVLLGAVPHVYAQGASRVLGGAAGLLGGATGVAVLVGCDE